MVHNGSVIVEEICLKNIPGNLKAYCVTDNLQCDYYNRTANNLSRSKLLIFQEYSLDEIPSL